MYAKKGGISSDCVIMVDDMHLQKPTQYQGGENVGADEKGIYTKRNCCLYGGGIKGVNSINDTCTGLMFNSESNLYIAHPPQPRQKGFFILC